MEDYIVITVNGSENKDRANTTISEWNTITNALENAGGMMEYRSSTTAGVISPTDYSVTNYIVFSGSIMLQPPLRKDPIYAEIMGQQVKVADAEVAKSWYSATYPNQGATGTVSSSLDPYYDYDDFKNKYSEYYGEWLYYKSQSGIDTISKIPVLICELKIGDKYCVEVTENNFLWLTKAQCDARKVDTTFSLGINPSVGDYLLCKEWEISNTLDVSKNVDATGTAIPIRSSDNLSGNVSFRIISPNYAGWEQQIRRHPTMFRSTKWWNTDLPVMEFVQNIYVKGFECKLYTDNAQVNNNKEKDLIYMTDVINNSIQSKDDLKFKFNTALTTSECMEKGINTSTKLSNVMNVSTNRVVLNLHSNITNQTGKAEELYINEYYNEYNQPKLIVETTLDSTSTDYWKHYKFNYFSGKEFYVINREMNLKFETSKYRLKQT